MLGVRDVRCYAAALLWVPSLSGVLLANVSIPLAFAARRRLAVSRRGVAAGGRARAHGLGEAALLAAASCGRSRPVGCARPRWAIVIGVAVTLAAWAAIGFDGLTGYPDLLRRLSEIQAENSYSIVGMAATLGLGDGVGPAR